MEHLTREQFQNIVNNLLLTAADCIAYFSNWSFTPAPVQEVEESPNMIRC